MGHWTYLVLEVIWAVPIIVMQWLLGLDLMIRRWKVWLPGILIPSLYLSFADSFAINGHTWTINPDFSLNIFLPLGVPLEELIFFVLTNTLVVQGLILLAMPGVRARVRRLLRVVRYGPTAIASATDTQETPAVVPIDGQSQGQAAP